MSDYQLQVIVENLSPEQLEAEAERIAQRMDGSAKKSRRCCNRHGVIDAATVEHERHRDIEYEWAGMRLAGARPDQCVECIRRELQGLRDKRKLYYRDDIWTPWEPGRKVDDVIPETPRRSLEYLTWAAAYARKRGTHRAVHCICNDGE